MKAEKYNEGFQNIFVSDCFKICNILTYFILWSYRWYNIK